MSPAVDDPLRIATLLADALIHIDAGDGHGAAFGKACRKVGLDGRKTAPVLGPELFDRVRAIIAELGAYPHAVLDARVGRPLPQPSRHRSFLCPQCGWRGQSTAYWIGQCLPICGRCRVEMPATAPPGGHGFGVFTHKMGRGPAQTAAPACVT